MICIRFKSRGYSAACHSDMVGIARRTSVCAGVCQSSGLHHSRSEYSQKRFSDHFRRADSLAAVSANPEAGASSITR